MHTAFVLAFAASEHPTKSAPVVKIWRQDCHEARDVSRHGSFRIVPRRPADWHCRIGMIAKAGLTFEVGGRRALLCDRATKSFWGSGDLQGSFGDESCVRPSYKLKGPRGQDPRQCRGMLKYDLMLAEWASGSIPEFLSS